MTAAFLPGAPLANKTSRDRLQFRIDSRDAGLGLLPPCQVFASTDRPGQIVSIIGIPTRDEFVLESLTQASQGVDEPSLLFAHNRVEGIDVGAHRRKGERNWSHAGHDFAQDLLIFQFGRLAGWAFEDSGGISDLTPIDANVARVLR